MTDVQQPFGSNVSSRETEPSMRFGCTHAWWNNEKGRSISAGPTFLDLDNITCRDCKRMFEVMYQLIADLDALRTGRRPI